MAEETVKYFESLQQKLIKDGFEETRIKDLYKRPEVDFETKGVSLFLVHQEARLNYDQFTTPASIQKASEYIQKYKTEFARVEKKYGVSKEIITAVILVETRLGKVVGGPIILNTLSSMASLADPEVRDLFWRKVSSSSRLTRKEYEKWVGKKSKWAYKELKAFLKYTNREEMDPASIPGSYAGAMGIPQFMPSNIRTLAKDGNNDGRIDLFNHADAISSVAYYLKHYGWHPGIDDKKAYKVLLRYNYSKYYANTIIKISKLLKG
ncbi:lytic murein transglycosylase [Thermodesulfobacteriota bacterium]